MKLQFKRLFIVLAALIGLASVPLATASAYDPLKACSAGANSSSACNKSTADPISGPNGALAKVTKIVATVAGIAAVILIIVAALNMVTADGDASKVKTARNSIIGAAIGLVIVVLARAIITFVLNKV